MTHFDSLHFTFMSKIHLLQNVKVVLVIHLIFFGLHYLARISFFTTSLELSQDVVCLLRTD